MLRRFQFPGKEGAHCVPCCSEEEDSLSFARISSLSPSFVCTTSPYGAVCLFGGFPFLVNSHGVFSMTVLYVITNNHGCPALQLKRVIVDRCSRMNKRFRKLEAYSPREVFIVFNQTSTKRASLYSFYCFWLSIQLVS